MDVSHEIESLVFEVEEGEPVADPVDEIRPSQVGDRRVSSDGQCYHSPAERDADAEDRRGAALQELERVKRIPFAEFQQARLSNREGGKASVLRGAE